MNWNYYAQLDSNDICGAITQTTGSITGPNIIFLGTEELPVIGKRWTGSSWEDVPPPPEPTTEN
jgi:hypothetical protein